MKELRGTRYLTAESQGTANKILELPFMDYIETLDFYAEVEKTGKDSEKAMLNANDRFYLLTNTLKRYDAMHPWLFERCREVEADPDGYLDLWARYHYKSSIGTFAGIIQEIIIDPEITIAILSGTLPIAQPFLVQIQQELENNDDLKRIHEDVFYKDPRKESPLWSREEGIIVKRRGNPKEATVEAHGVIEAMPTGRHFDLLNYDDLVNEMLVTNPDMVKKVTQRWEMTDNLGSAKRTRKWHWGTRYSFADTYGVLLERKALKERRYAATHNGKKDGNPVFLTKEKWEQVKTAQRSTLPAQMLLNPVADSEATFVATNFKHYDTIPSVMNVYIMCDPSKGTGARSDRTAIAVIGVDVSGNRYLLDGVCHRMKLSQRYEYLTMLEEKWRNHPGVQICIVGYEQYGMQSDLEVIQDKQLRDDNFFPIEELNTPRQGKHSKPDRIQRLQPDFDGGIFYLPAVVYHPDYGGKQENQALWDVWTEEDFNRMQSAGGKNIPAVNTIVYRPMQGLTRQQRYCEATQQQHRIVGAIRRRDEEKKVYDLTRVALEELIFHPFSQHDDFIDAMSRLYDLNPQRPTPFESLQTEPEAYLDA